MLPVHKVLELLWPELCNPTNPLGQRFICSAISKLEQHGIIEKTEAIAATIAVMDGVDRLCQDNDVVYLIQAAKRTGAVPVYSDTGHPVYIAFRDQWLRDLIEKEKIRAARPL